MLFYMTYQSKSQSIHLFGSFLCIPEARELIHMSPKQPIGMRGGGGGGVSQRPPSLLLVAWE
jgi:hypothetical protein